MPGFFSAIALFIKELMLLVSYVKNNAFPQPLAEDEEEKHLRLMAQGNQHSRNLLIEHNLRLVAHIVKTLCSKSDVNHLFYSGGFWLLRQEDIKLKPLWK
ncbi:N-acetylglucosamine kinase-like BadF-type ATPase [Paenibacillus sp. PvR052]|nr:N-acetylglucosamine kinase-like BadF-type ATPase [Paenibacillus sp. PvP091]MBP1168129.1 N-acetylglucosamine kinase-like BadF-type ATPase [Paenibacillus sp. PvR098]MBP2439157.1 N-acetylglucosamine kinase-like BadF-type ATPase [Paenibacillus sp. PvP052]